MHVHCVIHCTELSEETVFQIFTPTNKNSDNRLRTQFYVCARRQACDHRNQGTCTASCTMRSFKIKIPPTNQVRDPYKFDPHTVTHCLFLCSDKMHLVGITRGLG